VRSALAQCTDGSRHVDRGQSVGDGKGTLRKTRNQHGQALYYACWRCWRCGYSLRQYRTRQMIAPSDRLRETRNVVCQSINQSIGDRPHKSSGLSLLSPDAAVCSRRPLPNPESRRHDSERAVQANLRCPRPPPRALDGDQASQGSESASN
jgi:hypothetical protein